MLDSAIYTISHRDTGEVLYVGASIQTKDRWRQHRDNLVLGKHTNAKIQAICDEVGIDKLQFERVERVSNTTQLKVKEQYYIDTLNPSCNLSRTSGYPWIAKVIFPYEPQRELSQQDYIEYKDAAEIYEFSVTQIRYLVKKQVLRGYKRMAFKAVFICREAIEALVNAPIAEEQTEQEQAKAQVALKTEAMLIDRSVEAPPDWISAEELFALAHISSSTGYYRIHRLQENEIDIYPRRRFPHLRCYYYDPAWVVLLQHR